MMAHWSMTHLPMERHSNRFWIFNYFHFNFQPSSRYWNCHACTFRNRATVDICEMCAKSRRSVLDSESTGDDYETTNGDEEFDKSLTDEGDRNVVICSKCTLKNKVSNFVKSISKSEKQKSQNFLKQRAKIMCFTIKVTVTCAHQSI